MTDWIGRNVFVTGVNGFVGGNLTKELVLRGANVFGLIRSVSEKNFISFEGANSEIVQVIGDLCDRDLLERVLSENAIDTVFHLAAQVEVGVGALSPFTTWETNVRGTYTLMESIRLFAPEISSIVIASTDKAYGTYPVEMMPYKEDYPLKPQYPYDTSKACSDLIAQSYSTDLFRLPIAVTRFCNIYGPGQLNFTAVVPDAICSALNYSKFEPRGNGEQIRDFLFVSDVVDLYIRIAEELRSDPERIRGQIFNAGTNEPRTIRSVVVEVFELCESNAELSIILSKMANRKTTGEIDTQFMDFEKVNSYFGWSPSTPFRGGLEQTISWFRKFLNQK